MKTLSDEMAATPLAMPKILNERHGSGIFRIKFDYTDGKIELFVDPVVSTDKFKLTIHRSAKRLNKISFVHVSSGWAVCLLRVDIKPGPHWNPAIVSKNVPERFLPFAGKKITGSHVHYYVEGYFEKWALPVKDSEFSFFNDDESLEMQIQKVLDAVREAICLTSPLAYDPILDYE